MTQEIPVADCIKAKLLRAFEEKNAEVEIELIDDSDKHLGHAGHDARGESHFSLVVTSPYFESMNRVKQQQFIYDILAEELKDRVHALSLKTGF